MLWLMTMHTYDAGQLGIAERKNSVIVGLVAVVALCLMITASMPALAGEHCTADPSLWGNIVDTHYLSWEEAEAACGAGCDGKTELGYVKDECYQNGGTWFNYYVVSAGGDPDNGCNGGSCSCNPVDTATGGKFLKYIDIAVAPNSPLKFSRYYNSQNSHWTFDFTQKLVRGEDLASPGGNSSEKYTRYYLHRPNGRTENIIIYQDMVTLLQSTYEYLNNDGTVLAKESNGDWMYTLVDGTNEIYESAGLLKEIDYVNGQKLKITHAGTTITVTDDFNNSIAMETADNTYSKVLSVIGAAGTISYQYSGANLTKATFEDGKYIQYLYENASFPYAITKIIDERGRAFKGVAYDTAGKVSTSALGDFSSNENFNYIDDYTTEYTNQFGKNSTIKFINVAGIKKISQITGEATSHCLGAESYITYDSNGFKDKVTDWNGNVTDYDYSENGLLEKETEGLKWVTGSRVLLENTNETRITEQDWDSSTHQLIEKRAPGVTTHYDYWPNHRLWKVVETDTTNVSTVFGSSNGLQREWTYNYTYFNGTGLPQDLLVESMTVDGPLEGTSDSTEYHYDISGHLTSIVNAAGFSTLYSDFNSRGQPQTVTDANGVITKLGYHARGWLETVTVKDPGGNSAQDSVTQYIWYPNGTLEQLTFPDGSYLHYEYNDARHLIEVRNNLGEKITYEPNAMGEWTEARTYNASADMKRLQSRAFDELGRLMDLFGNNSQHTHFGYDVNDNKNSVVEYGVDRTITTTFNHDSLNRLKEVLKPVTTDSNGTPVTVNVNTYYGYDAADNLTSVTDPNGHATAYEYDGFHQKLKQTSPDTGLTQYWYDPQGNLTDKQDARSVHVIYHYDLLGRVTWVQYPNSPEDVHYFYDEVSSENPYVKGKLTRIVDASGSTEYIYDSRGNIVQVNTQIAGNSFTIKYGYDLANKLVKTVYPDGRILNYKRDDSLGRVTAITTQKYSNTPEHSVVSNIEYMPFGPVTGYTYGNGMVRQVPYDLDYRIQAITVAGTNTNLNLGYAYDAFNNITGIADGVDSARSQAFDYDDLHRLQNASGYYGSNVDNIHYEYDPVGNRLFRTMNMGGVPQTQEDYGYAAVSNKLNSVTLDDGSSSQVRSLLYTDAGNTESDSVAGSERDYQYGDSNRLLGISLNGSAISSYQYNALGQRVTKVVGGDTTHFIYDLSGNLLAEADSAGKSKREYLYLNEKMVAVVDVADEPILSIAVSHQKEVTSTEGVIKLITTIVVSNTGVVDASNVELVNAFPSGFEVSSITSTSGSCNSAATSCQFAVVPAGSSITVTIEGLESGIVSDAYTSKLVDSASSTDITLPESTYTYDMDGDTLPDNWELTQFGNLNQTADSDFDSDGFTESQEYNLGTSPLVTTTYSKQYTGMITQGNASISNQYSVNMFDSASDAARSSMPISGKTYIEFSGPSGVMIGLSNGSSVFDWNSGAVNSGYYYAANNRPYASVSGPYGACSLYGGVAGMAIDSGSRKFWLRCVDGSWSFGDPETGVGGAEVQFQGSLYLAVNNGGAGTGNITVDLNVGQAAFTYSVPQGFTEGLYTETYTDATGGGTGTGSGQGNVVYSGFETQGSATVTDQYTVTTYNSAADAARTTFPVVGKVYVEFALNVYSMIGVANSGTPFDWYQGASNSAYYYAYNNQGYASVTGPYSSCSLSGGTAGMAIDADQRKFWLRCANGAWAIGNPEINEGGATINFTGDIYLAIGNGGAGTGTISVSFNLGQLPFNYAVPVGFAEGLYQTTATSGGQ